MAGVRDVVNYLKHLRDLDEKHGQYYSLSNLKLQKLLYYCQGGHYKWDNKQLISDVEFEAWKYGPVVPEIYREYSKYGQNDIPSVSAEENFLLTEVELETIESVWNQLKEMHAYTLVNSTHEEDPWINNYHEGMNNRIPNLEIMEFFQGEL